MGKDNCVKCHKEIDGIYHEYFGEKLCDDCYWSTDLDFYDEEMDGD